MRTRSRPRSPGSAGDSPRSAGPWTLALRRLRHDRSALVFGALFVLILLAILAAPLYASEIAHTTPAENHLTDTTVVDGKRVDVVALDSIPIGRPGRATTSSEPTTTAATRWSAFSTALAPRSSSASAPCCCRFSS